MLPPYETTTNDHIKNNILNCMVERRGFPVSSKETNRKNRKT